MLTTDQRQVFAVLAETLIPATDTMPSATSAGVADTLLDQVLGYRPDLVDDFVAALASCDGQDPESALDGAGCRASRPVRGADRAGRGRLLPQPRGEGGDAL